MRYQNLHRGRQGRSPCRPPFDRLGTVAYGNLFAEARKKYQETKNPLYKKQLERYARWGGITIEDDLK